MKSFHKLISVSDSVQQDSIRLQVEGIEIPDVSLVQFITGGFTDLVKWGRCTCESKEEEVVEEWRRQMKL